MAKEPKKEPKKEPTLKVGSIFFNKLNDSIPEQKLVKDQIREQLGQGKVVLRGPNQEVVSL